MYKKIVEKVDKDTQEAVTQIIGTSLTTWNNTDANGREYLIHNLKDFINQFEHELIDEILGTCNIDRTRECSGCGDCSTY